MPSRTRSTALSDFEWGEEGMTMPVANAENKLLESEVLRKQKLIAQLRIDLSGNDEHVIAMRNHLKNVKQEISHYQTLMNARNKEIEAEDHMKKIKERQQGRLAQEVMRYQKELEELKEKRNVYENGVFRQTQRLEELRSKMNWDQQALEAWLEESAHKDEDITILQKYTRQDESKIKELSLRIEHLTDEASKKKRLLDHEMTDTVSAQMELNKTADEFRKAQEERITLIDQWKSTIEQMERRDDEMNDLSIKLVEVKMEVDKREMQIKEKQQFFDSERENNKDMDKKISMAERTTGKMRLDLQDAERAQDQLQSELDTLKRTVDRTAIDLEATRAEVTQLKRQVASKKEKLEDAKRVREDLVVRLEKANESNMTADEKASQMDSLLKDEEKRQLEIEKDLKRLREVHFRKQQELHNAGLDERGVEAEIQGSRATIRNLNSKVTRLDHDMLKQQEIIYNQDFAIQQLERRINRMMGEQSNEEKLQLEAQIKELLKELDEKNKTHNMLDKQINTLQDEVRRVKRELEQTSQEKADVTSKIEEVELHNDTAQRELRKIISKKQDLMVEMSIWKLEIKRLHGVLNSKAGDVLSLEKRRLQLQTAMKERQQEIVIHMDMLRAQLRAAEQERHQISSELHERISKIDKLEKRYEILMVSMAPPEGEEEKSQAYFVIKAAQDKEELQREGDLLEAKIRKAEKEIRALDNTLKLMNDRNATYRKNFNKVTDTSDEMEEKMRLEEQLRAAMEKLKYKKRQMRELEDDLETMGKTLDNLLRDEAAYQEMMSDKQTKTAQVKREIEEQNAKIDRCSKQNSKLSRETRKQKNAKEEMPEEKEFEVRELRELNKQAMKYLGDCVRDNPDIAPTVNYYVSQGNIPPIPSPTGSVSSSRNSSQQGSARSSISSQNSAGRGPIRGINIGADLPAADSRRSSRSSTSSNLSNRRPRP